MRETDGQRSLGGWATSRGGAGMRKRAAVVNGAGVRYSLMQTGEAAMAAVML